MKRIPPELCERCANVEGCPLRAIAYEDDRAAHITECSEFVDSADIFGPIPSLDELEDTC